MTVVGWSGAAIPGVEQQIIGTWMARNTWDNLAGAQWLTARADPRADPAIAGPVAVSRPSSLIGAP